MGKLAKWLLLAITALFSLSADRFEPTTGYSMHPGYPIILDSWIERAPVTIADINNDGSQELLLPTYDGKIYAWSASGALLPGFPATSGGKIYGRLALGDLNQDGKLEIAAGVESNSPGVGAQVYIWKSDGGLLSGWPQSTACYSSSIYCGMASIVLADLDNDANLDVIAGTDNRNLADSDPGLYVPNLYVWRSDGQAMSGSWPNEDDHNVALLGAMAVGDLNGDGKADIVTGRDYNRLFAYDNVGNHLSGWPVYVFWPEDSDDFEDDRISFARSAVTLADLNGDDQLEYIVNGLRSYANTPTFYNTDLLVYAPDGKRWPGWELPASGTGVLSQERSWIMLEAPAIGDLNGDKRPDIVVATQDGFVRAYTADKQLLWEFDYAQGELHYASETVIGDVDGDGWNEVVFGTFDANTCAGGPVGVWILDHNGEVESGAPLDVGDKGIRSAPALADLDGDGKLEIAAVNCSGTVFVWDAPGDLNPARLPWPMARHDLQRTALFENPERIFADGFESGNLAAWSAKKTDLGDLAVNKAAALDGVKGMRALIDDNNPIYVTDDTPDGEPSYAVRFQFDPHSIAMASNDSHTIFIAQDLRTNYVTDLQILLRKYNGAYQLRAAVRKDDLTWITTGWFAITDQPHEVMIDWNAAGAAGANDGRMRFFIDGVLKANRTGIDNDSFQVDRARLGAIAGIDSGTRGTLYFDLFESFP